MSKLFITVLGTGNYFDCNYYLGDKSIRTPFIQEALIKFLYPEKDFKMKILLTETAKERNYKKLESILSRENIDYELVMIPEGKDQDELWEIFDKLSETIDKTAVELCEDRENLDINIDITHSLRNIPMQIVVAMNYLKLFNNINLENIYYGAFELGDKKIDNKIFENKKIVQDLKASKMLSLSVDEMDIDEKIKQDLLKALRQNSINLDILNELEAANSIDDLSSQTIELITDKNNRDYSRFTITHAPICNLNTYYELLNWSNAINSFIKCGNTAEINNIVSQKKKIIFISENTAEAKKNIILLEKVVTALNQFTNCINTCRGMFLDNSINTNSIKTAADKLNKELNNLTDNISIKPLKKLFKLVKKEIEPFVDKSTLEIGIATIDWCNKYNLTQQGFTALDETLKTLICMKLNLNENEFKNRENIANVLLTCTKRKLDEIRFNKDLTDDEIKFLIEKLDELRQNEELSELAESTKNYRNDINHFGFNSSGATTYETLSFRLNEFYEKIKKYCDGEFPWIEENTTEA